MVHLVRNQHEATMNQAPGTGRVDDAANGEELSPNEWCAGR